MSKAYTRTRQAPHHPSFGNGPMSKNTVEACGRIASRHGTLLKLTATGMSWKVVT